MRARVAIIGGGWAGLAAAVHAVQQGLQVTLFDMAPQLGGRARSIDAAGMSLDNGQHILIGAYVETLALMRSVGVRADDAFVRMPLRITAPDGNGLRLHGGPPTLAFVIAVLRQRGWRLRDRLALLMAASRWVWSRFQCDSSTTVAALTATLPRAIRDELIDPLCVAALNTASADASAAVFLRVLHDALLSGPGSADLLLPRVGLSELLPAPAHALLLHEGADVRLACRVESLEAMGATWSVDGEPFDSIVLATSAVEAARLTRALAPAWSHAAAALRCEPIVTVYLRSAGTRLAEPMLALRDDDRSPAQFVFDRGQLGGADGLLAFVVSGAQPWVERGMEATTQATERQAVAALSSQLRGPLQRVRTVVEKRATFRCTPGLERPAAVVMPGLFAAGDYIAGPYPATLEGAVRSGTQAVKNALNAARTAPPAARR